MADGSLKPIEDIAVGDTVMSIDIPELSRDVHDVETSGHPEYQWCSNGAMDETKIVPGYVASIKPGTHSGFYVINHRIKATFEHPFLIRRDDQYHFTSAELLRVGDVMIKPGHQEEAIESIDQQNGTVSTYNFEVSHFNTYCAEGVWVHNTSGTFGGGSGYSASTQSGGDPQGFDITVFSSVSTSESSGSGSGSDKSSGSGGSGDPTVSGSDSGSDVITFATQNN